MKIKTVAKNNRLAGKTLTVLSITRQNIIDATFVGCCDNCGRVIANTANVKDENGQIFTIGLDCKKTLIDKPAIDAILRSSKWDAEYKAKELKSELAEVTKFLKFAAQPDVEVVVDTYGSLIIYDNLPSRNFPESGLVGNTIYIQNLGFLQKMGLGDFIAKVAIYK